MSSCTVALRDVKCTVSKAVYRTLTRISPRLNTQFHFWRATGCAANLKEPVTFSEKLSWLKLYRYANDPLVKQCADKLRVRDYVKEKNFEHLLIPLLGVFTCPEEIPWADLPEKFALKWNFGCGFNLLCSDKKDLDIPMIIHCLKRWGRDPYWLDHAELQYQISERRIICEEFLEMPPGEELLDYKVYCFHGKARAILVIARPSDGEKAAVFMSPDWELISDVPSRYKETIHPPKPSCLNEMLRAAEVLSEPFPFVRMDFYECGGKPIFGEMTFTPATGVLPSEVLLAGKSMGEYIHLEEL